MELAPLQEIKDQAFNALAVGAVTLAAVISYQIYDNIGETGDSGCPARAEGFSLQWVSAPIANSLDGADRLSHEAVARDCGDQ
jgi:hypothetical protein